MSAATDSVHWDLPDPFVLPITVGEEDIDNFGHANNVVYVRWLEDASWTHIEQLGMTWALHETTGKAMVITRTEIDYLMAANVDENLLLGTWLTDFDGRLRSVRQFQLVRINDGKTLARALSWHACVGLKSQRPTRVPAEYKKILDAAVVAGGRSLDNTQSG